MTLTQWVNLPKKSELKDKDIDSLDRCGTISIEVEVEKAGDAISYRARITPVGSNNETYNSAELKRNPNFRVNKDVLGIVDEKKTRIDNMKLPAAGGNRYKVEVEDAAGNIVSSVEEVETQRKLYYQVISMDGANSVPSYSLASMEVDSLKHNIKLEKKGSENKIPYLKTITLHEGDNNSHEFGACVSKAFTIKNEQKKLGVAAVFSEYIADMGNHDFKVDFEIGVPNKNVAWSLTELRIAGNAYLWHGLDDDEDKAKKWFIDGYISYHDPVSGESLGYFVSRSDIELNGVKAFAFGGYHQVKIKIDAQLSKLLSKKTGNITFSIEVNIVNGWTNGFSWNYNGIDLITCARRTLWQDMPTETRDYTWIHEVGHRFGMTAWGDSTHETDFPIERNKLPDGPATLYGENRGVNDKSHSGPHCEKGATYDAIAKQWSGKPGCVMFGANGIGGNHAPKEYCDECTPIVRKLDLSS